MSVDESELDEEAYQFTQARFPIDLNLPSAESSLLEDARKAIRREFRDSAKWKRLRCRKVSVVSESESGTIYELEIGHAVEFDWTWEGAVAFRPLLLREFEDTQATFFENGSLDPEIDDSIVWSGEVLEVDEATGRIFIVVTNPEHPPRKGSFYVRPFEFLAFLDAVYNEPAFTEIRDMLPPRLAASRGGIHPDVTDPANVGLDHLKQWWRKAWSVLWGPPGTGKTYTTGQQVANVLNDARRQSQQNVHIQSITSPSDLNALLLRAQSRDVVHIDEAHELGKPYQTALYLALDKRKIVLCGGNGSSPQSLPLADFTVLLSTTDEYNLLQPLRDRMRLTLRFEFYSVAELAIVVAQRSQSLGWDVHENVLPHIARRSRGTPRLALRLLQSCHRVCRADGQESITIDHLNRACRLEQIDDLGLGVTEQRYLNVLGDQSGRLNVIASVIGLPTRTVSEVMEPFLIRAGLIVKDDQGRRQLTAAGLEHVSNSRESIV